MPETAQLTIQTKSQKWLNLTKKLTLLPKVKAILQAITLQNSKSTPY